MKKSAAPAEDIDVDEVAVPPMPEMRQGLLDRESMFELCKDLTQLTKILSLQTRVRGNTNASVSSDQLSNILEDLWVGNLQAVQIRYYYDDHEWTDTLFRIDCHVRVVRCQHPAT